MLSNVVFISFAAGGSGTFSFVVPDLSWTESPGAFSRDAQAPEPGCRSGDEHRQCAGAGEAWEGKSPKLCPDLGNELREGSGVRAKRQMKT